jgi:hypothetical protein
MERPAVPLIGFTEINGNLNGNAGLSHQARATLSFFKILHAL